MNRVQLANRTDVGRQRTANEDYFASYENNRWQVVLLSDGMGGVQGGDTASLITVNTIHLEFQKGFAEPVQFLKKSIALANQVVLTTASQAPEFAGMGATVVVLLYDKKHQLGYYAHVGDSRLYLFRKSRLYPLTEDHSEVMEMVRRGILTAEEARTHPRRHRIIRCIGRDTGIADICQTPIHVQEGDHLLLCSDGLTDMLSDDEIQQVLQRPDNPQVKSDLLVARANQKGGRDNITVQLLVMEAASASRTSKWRHLAVGLAGVLIMMVVIYVGYRLWQSLAAGNASKNAIAENSQQKNSNSSNVSTDSLKPNWPKSGKPTAHSLSSPKGQTPHPPLSATTHERLISQKARRTEQDSGRASHGSPFPPSDFETPAGRRTAIESVADSLDLINMYFFPELRIISASPIGVSTDSVSKKDTLEIPHSTSKDHGMAKDSTSISNNADNPKQQNIQKKTN